VSHINAYDLLMFFTVFVSILIKKIINTVTILKSHFECILQLFIHLCSVHAALTAYTVYCNLTSTRS